MRRAFVAAAIALTAGSLFLQWLAPGNVVDWLLAGAAPCG
jgi:hypothetical protein